MTKIKYLSDEVLSSLTETEKDFLLSWKRLYEDKEFRDKLEEILKPEKVKTIYNLEKGDIYYSLLNDGTLEKVIWNNDTFDNQRLDIGNVFLTKEDAEFEAEYLKIKAELKRYASVCEEPIDWKNKEQGKYYLYYDYINRKILTSNNRVWVHDVIYFTDYDVLKQAIKEIGEDRIKKHYLGVK